MVFSRNVVVEDLTPILKDARAGHTEAQKKILRYFSGYISFCARKFFLSEEDRKDLMQEGRIALFRAIHRFNSERGIFAPYARLVIRRQMNRAAGKIIYVHSAEKVQEPEDIQRLPTLMESRTPELEAIEIERRREMALQVGRNLTALETRVLSLFLQGLSYRQMAQRLRRSEKSVDNALRRIRDKVKV